MHGVVQTGSANALSSWPSVRGWWFESWGDDVRMCMWVRIGGCLEVVAWVSFALVGNPGGIALGLALMWLLEMV